MLRKAAFSIRSVRLNYRSLALIVALTFAFSSLAQAQNVYRWKDADGRIHYSKALPPDASRLPYDVLSSNGILIEKINDPNAPEPIAESTDASEPEDTGPEPLYTEAQKKAISDRLLLLRYHSEEELLEAMQLEVDQLKYDLRLLEATRNSVIKSLKGQIRSAADQQRAGRPVNPAQIAAIDQLRGRLVTNASAKGRLDARELQIRGSFNNDIDRYRRLMKEAEEFRG